MPPSILNLCSVDKIDSTSLSLKVDIWDYSITMVQG